MSNELKDLFEKYDMMVSEHARKFHNLVIDESAYRESCKKIRDHYRIIEQQSRKEGNPIGKYI